MEEDQSKSFAQILFPGQTTSGFPISELGEFGYESFLRNPMMVISDEEIQRRKLLECAWQEQENPGICLAQMHSIYLPSGRDVLPGGTYAPEYYPSVPMLPQWLDDSLGALIESPYIFGKVGWNFLKDIWLSDLDDYDSITVGPSDIYDFSEKTSNPYRNPVWGSAAGVDLLLQMSR